MKFNIAPFSQDGVGSGYAARLRRTAVLVSVWTATFFSPPLAAQSPVRVDSFYAASVGRVKCFAYILPNGYQQSTQYPVLYLLHGYSDTYLGWSTRTKIAEYVHEYPVIVIMPDGENSWYVNEVGDPSARFEDYLVSELPHYVRQRFSVDTTRQAIAGLSMGGNGSLVIAMRHPALYRFAGSLSGAITVPHWNSDSSSLAVQYLHASLVQAYGATPGSFWDAHDVFYLFKNLAHRPAPYLYLVIGIQDEYRDFVSAHHQLIDSLRSKNIAYEYHETQGNHGWAFWDREIQPLLRRMMETFGQSKPNK